VTVYPPAKINLTLDVGPLRPDGYHEIDTVFQAVSLYDELTIELRDGPVLDEENLVMRALRLLDADAPWSVRLVKNIPSRAGLGGGSSDAAGALIAGARLLGRDERDLPELALQLGSDVPFFLVGGAARGQGRGEKLTPLTDLAFSYWFCLAKPEDGMSTSDAFQRLDAIDDREAKNRTGALVDLWERLDARQSKSGERMVFPRSDLQRHLGNDFLRCYRKSDSIASVWERMSGCGERLVCGSGTTVACCMGPHGHKRPKRLSKYLLWEGYWSRVVRTLKRSEWPP